MELLAMAALPEGAAAQVVAEPFPEVPLSKVTWLP